MSKGKVITLTAAASFVALSLAGRSARAGNCSADVGAASPVYMLIGATQEPLIKALGKKLREGPNPMTLVYRTSGSCTNIAALYATPAVKLTQNPFYIPSVAQDAAWDPTKPAPQCTMDTAGGVDLDVVNSNVFVDACNPGTAPAGIKEFQGPIQGYGFVVPKASSQRAITAEEAYFVYGFGQAGQVSPWLDNALIYTLPPTRSTLISTVLNAGVPVSKVKGTQLADPNAVVDAVAQSAQPEKTIGIVGVELYDLQRDKLKILAYQAYKQKFAYFPDSTATAFDKLNVRLGLYSIWSPTVYLTKVDNAGVPVSARVKYLLDLLRGLSVSPAPGFEPLDEVVAKGLIPNCAMKVTRSFEAGPMSPFDSPEPCHCYFEKKVGASSAACTACASDQACGAGKCRHGYCEVK